MTWQGPNVINQDEAGAEMLLRARQGALRTGEHEAGAAGDDEEEAGDARAVGGRPAAPAQLLQLVHHVLAARPERPQVLLQAGVHHADHAAASTQSPLQAALCQPDGETAPQMLPSESVT